MSLLAVVKMKNNVLPNRGTAATRATTRSRSPSLNWNDLMCMRVTGDSSRLEKRRRFHLDQGIDVEDQTNPAVTQDGRTGQERVVFECFGQTFDDDFLLAEQAIHQQATVGAASLDDDHDAIGGFG